MVWQFCVTQPFHSSLPKRKGNTRVYKNLCANVHNSFLCNGWQLGPTPDDLQQTSGPTNCSIAIRGAMTQQWKGVTGWNGQQCGRIRIMSRAKGASQQRVCAMWLYKTQKRKQFVVTDADRWFGDWGKSFLIPIMVMVSWLYTYVRTDQNCTLEICAGYCTSNITQ